MSPSPEQPLSQLCDNLLVGDALASRNLAFSYVQIAKQLQFIEKPLIDLDIHDDCRATFSGLTRSRGRQRLLLHH